MTVHYQIKVNLLKKQHDVLGEQNNVLGKQHRCINIIAAQLLTIQMVDQQLCMNKMTIRFA